MMDVEKHLLAGLFAWPEALADVSGVLNSEDFFHDRYGCVFGHMLRLATQGRGVDAVTVQESLISTGELAHVGGSDTLMDIGREMVTSSVMAMEYAGAVRVASIRRRMKSALLAGLDAVGDPTRPIEDVIALTEGAALIGASKAARNDLRPASSFLSETFRILEQQSKGEITGLHTGFIDLDRHLCGLQKGDLIVLAGRPAMGKTSLALDIAANVAIEQKKTVPFFEVEMSGRATIERLLFARSKVNGQLLKSGRLPQRDFPRLSLAVAPIQNSGLFVDDSVGITPLQIISKCRRLKAKRGLDLVVVDCLQKMKGDGKYGGNKRLEVSDISLHLKNMAKELDVPVIAISHLSREVERRPDKVPELSDLHESGNIEQDADIVMLLYRKEEYFDVEEAERGKADIIFAKYRNGETGIKHLHFHNQFSTFGNWSARTDKPPEGRSDGWYGKE